MKMDQIGRPLPPKRLSILEGHWRKSEKVMDSGQNPVEPLLWVYLIWQETNHIDLYYVAN